MKRSLLVASFLGMVLFFACQKESITPVSTNVDCSAVTYAGTIAPLIAQNCSGSACHGSNGREGSLMTYAQLIRYVNNGEFERLVIDRQTMPRNGSLTSEELGQIQCWLDDGAGALDN